MDRLTALQVFVTVVEQGSLSAAAERARGIIEDTPDMTVDFSNN